MTRTVGQTDQFGQNSDMSWNHRGGRSDWETGGGSNQSDGNKEFGSWPSARDHESEGYGGRSGGDGGGRDRGFNRGRDNRGGGHSGGGYRDSPRMTDHRTGGGGGGRDGGKWKHDKFNDDYNRGGYGGGGHGRGHRERHDSDRSDNYNDRSRSYDRRDSWAKGGSWGNVNRVSNEKLF